MEISFCVDAGCTWTNPYGEECTRLFTMEPDRLHEGMSESVSRQFREFCGCLGEGLRGIGYYGELPPFHLTSEEDELYMEWIFDGCRFGFDFYEDPVDSGWFVLRKDGNGMHRRHSKFGGSYDEAVKAVTDFLEGLRSR